MQPGNNYRAGASCLADAISQANQQTADALNANGGYWSGYSVPLVWSPMLTVWRKLHVEFDSMTAAPTTVTGREPDWRQVFIEDLTINAETTTFHLAGPMSGHSPHQYEGGRVVIIDNGWSLHVIDHTNNSLEIDRVLVPPEWSYVEDHFAILKDDDPNSGLLPHLYAITPFIKNAYADAYVDIVELDEGYNPNRSIPFDLYVTSTQMLTGWGWNDSKDLGSSNGFWTTFVMAGYQAGGYTDLDNQDRDNDPDPMIDNSNPSGPTWPGDEYDELGLFGWTATFGDWDGIVFRATIYDLPQCAHFENQVLAHEIGHSAGNAGSEEQHHNEGGLMSEHLHELHETFRAPTLKRFREADKW